MTLDELARDQAATIVEVTGTDGISVRLLEMGLTEGETIRYLAAAPMGDPIEYGIRGYRLSLRRSEAKRVRVELV
ncbi:ferrous iron transport protein A [Planctomyces sp. SH-PL14]|uniref:FeoA family protein n=1 Tax=Planctomyces sp. SH-PL14 TaxID=1632864 RepID=UPI00078B65BD|nr:ferrous iron transport protein A [Planctomyces sp. SH-PL14]AMV17819.1 FeoA domain protein [Planctomyces sp. SH-PL14]